MFVNKSPYPATQNGDEEMICILLYGGADLTLKGKDGKTRWTWQWNLVTKKPSLF